MVYRPLTSPHPCPAIWTLVMQFEVIDHIDLPSLNFLVTGRAGQNTGMCPRMHQ
jgi:hypothetical protein